MSEGPASYIADQPEPQARALRALRKLLIARIAHAGIAVEEVISYGMPGFRILSGKGQGKILLGYAAWKDHLALYPHSGAVLGRMKTETRGMSQTKSALHIGIGSLPDENVVDRMIHLRLEETG
jgi:uncharacterized protein YdhG (YjbR/CyaY superfamily)